MVIFICLASVELLKFQIQLCNYGTLDDAKLDQKPRYRNFDFEKMILNIVIAVGINIPMYFINLWPGLPENGDFRHFCPFYIMIHVR